MAVLLSKCCFSNNVDRSRIMEEGSRNFSHYIAICKNFSRFESSSSKDSYNFLIYMQNIFQISGHLYIRNLDCEICWSLRVFALVIPLLLVFENINYGEEYTAIIPARSNEMVYVTSSWFILFRYLNKSGNREISNR